MCGSASRPGDRGSAVQPQQTQKFRSDCGSPQWEERRQAWWEAEHRLVQLAEPPGGSTSPSSLWPGLSSSASREGPILTEGPGDLRPGAGRMRAGMPGRFPAQLLAPQRTKALEMEHQSSPWDRLPSPSPHPLGFSGRQGPGASFLPLAAMFSLPPGPHTWSLCFCSRCHLWSQSTWQLMAPGS